MKPKDGNVQSPRIMWETIVIVGQKGGFNFHCRWESYLGFGV